MANKDIISQLKKSQLSGRSGSDFPTGLKWEMVKKTKAKRKYIVCNGAEGEPGVYKDYFILKNYPEEVVDGIKIALATIDNSSAFLYLKKDYFDKFENKLKRLIGDSYIMLIKKRGGYLGGEETSVCEVIEGKRAEPRIKPPHVSEKGVFNFPTLINNVETFYYVSKIVHGKYDKTRFYTISGKVKNPGVFQLPIHWSIKKILQETKNYPKFNFFVKVGGKMTGEILLFKELNSPANGAGAIIVYRATIKPAKLMEELSEFFMNENCDKCVPCREGIYRINEMFRKKKLNKKLLDDIIFVLEKTSRCSLGRGAAFSFESIKKLY
ncbi:MAG: NADH-ubiquinone oxidoreductase-F iron-sulfur binding region domain-containing protein [Patescibacteria group bacterium]